MVERASLHYQLIEISRDYLGPAAERFIDRQVTTHLHKKPEDITSNDLLKLIDWIKPAFALLTNDSDLVDAYANQLLVLTQTKRLKRT